MLQPYNIISTEVVLASHDHRLNYTLLVEWAIELRTETLQDLAKKLNISRQKLSKFYKLQIYDFPLLSRILEYKDKTITMQRQEKLRKWQRIN